MFLDVIRFDKTKTLGEKLNLKLTFTTKYPQISQRLQTNEVRIVHNNYVSNYILMTLTSLNGHAP